MFGFVWSEGADKTAVGDDTALGNRGSGNEEEGVGAFDSLGAVGVVDTLGKTAEFVSSRKVPVGAKGGIP